MRRARIDTACALLVLSVVFLAGGCHAPHPPLLTASPNPIPLGATFGTTTITWTTDGRGTGYVYVVDQNGHERLFAAGDSGHQDAGWIDATRPFVFRLYLTDHQRPIASVTVTQHGDIYVALLATACALPLMLLGAWANRRWALELAPVCLVAFALWIKWSMLGIDFTPGYVKPHWILSSTLAVVAALVAPLLLMPRRYRLAAALGVDAVLTLLLLADALYFRFFGGVLTLSAAVGGSEQLRGVIPSVRALLEPGDGLYALDLAGFALLIPVYGFLSRGVPTVRLRARTGVALLVTALAAGAAAARLGSANPMSEMALGNAPGARLSIVAAVGLLPFHIYDLDTRWSDPALTSLHVGTIEKAKAEAYLERRFDHEQTPSALFGVAARRNLIVVMVESLASFPIGLEIGGRNVTPNLSAFAGQSLTFTDVFDQAYQGGTSDGEFVSMDSLLPLPAGAVSTRLPTNRFHSIAGILRERGYTALSAVGATAGTWNIGQMHPALGFEHSYFDDPGRPAERVYGWLIDDVLFHDMTTRLESVRPPFMAYVLTSSTHYPYELPAKYTDFPVGDLAGTRLGGYLQAVHYTDAAFGRFISSLRADGLLDSSIIAVFGDHRPFFDSLDDLNRLLKLSTATDAARWMTRRRLPLLVRLPNGAGHGERTIPGGHLDIAPTLLSLLGVPTSTAVMLGTDLTREARVGSSVVFRDGSFLDATALYVAGPRLDVPDACYHLPDGGPIDCATLASAKAGARRMRDVSDSILFGDLIPDLAPLVKAYAAGAPRE